MSTTASPPPAPDLSARLEEVLQANRKLTQRVEQLERRLDLAASILRATTDINSSLSFSEVVTHVLDKTQRLLSAKSCSLMLIDPGTGDLTIIGSRGLNEKNARSLRFKKGQGIAGWVAETGEGVVVADVTKDPRFVHTGSGRLAGESLACVPLQGPDGVMGVLNVDRPAGIPPFDEDEFSYVRIMAEHASVALKNARLHEGLIERATQLSTLYEVGSALASVLNVDRLLSLIVDSVVRVTGAQICSLMLLDSERKFLRIRVAKGLPEAVVKRIVIPLGEGISGHVAKTGEPLLVEDIETHPLFRRKSRKKYSSRSLLSVPLKIKGEVIGVLNVNNKLRGAVFTVDDQNLLTLFASHAAITIENANLYEHLEQLATTDGLTGLFVHRHFQEKLQGELSRAKRFRRPLSVCMMDIDHFKKVNDTYGHQTGDMVLRAVAALLRDRGGRDEDILARYGGEEFVLALVETPKRTALTVAERIRRTIAEHTFQNNDVVLPVTISIGVGSFPDDADNREHVIACADQALYHAKESGRNRVAYLGDDGQPQVYTP